MPRRKKRLPVKKTKRLSESYISLILGFFVVLVGAVLLILFTQNNTYDKINTAISIFQEPSNSVQTQKNETEKIYEVKDGDSLWIIAEKLYGSGYNWVELAKANKLENPNIISAGIKLVVPEVKKIVQNNGQIDFIQKNSITTSSYKVQKGDYLWDIAIRKYGDGYKWPEIAKVNNIPNPDLIYANTILKLP